MIHSLEEKENIISELREKLDQMTSRIEELELKLVLNDLTQFTTKTYLRGIKRPGLGRIYKKGTLLYCDNHDNQLTRAENALSLFYCNACGMYFDEIAMQRGRTVGTLPKWYCRACDIDICEYCLHDSKYLPE